MIRVWKFPLAMTDIQQVKMPKGARILAVKPQGNQVCLWALCDGNQPNEARQIAILGTGHNAPEYGALKFIETFQLHGGELVFHAFEIVDAAV
jgi:hypothetical protein